MENKTKISAEIFNNADFFSVGEQERLSETCIEEAIENFLSDYSEDQIPSQIPKITVYGYKKITFEEENPNIFEYQLDSFLETMHEEFGDFENSAGPATPAMREAWNNFINVFKSEYTIWRCEVCLKCEINVGEYLEDKKQAIAAAANTVTGDN